MEIFRKFLINIEDFEGNKGCTWLREFARTKKITDECLDGDCYDNVRKCHGLIQDCEFLDTKEIEVCSAVNKF